MNVTIVTMHSPFRGRTDSTDFLFVATTFAVVELITRTFSQEAGYSKVLNWPLCV